MARAWDRATARAWDRARAWAWDRGRDMGRDMGVGWTRASSMASCSRAPRTAIAAGSPQQRTGERVGSCAEQRCEFLCAAGLPSPQHPHTPTSALRSASFFPFPLLPPPASPPPSTDHDCTARARREVAPRRGGRGAREGRAALRRGAWRGTLCTGHDELRSSWTSGTSWRALELVNNNTPSTQLHSSAVVLRPSSFFSALRSRAVPRSCRHARCPAFALRRAHCRCHGWTWTRVCAARRRRGVGVQRVDQGVAAAGRGTPAVPPTPERRQALLCRLPPLHRLRNPHLRQKATGGACRRRTPNA